MQWRRAGHHVQPMRARWTTLEVLLARRAEVEPITRDRILTVAAAQMAQRGYRGTNLNDVAAQLGVTRQALYYHFANKQAILSSIFESLFGRLAASAKGMKAQPDSVRFQRMLSAYVDIILEHPAIARVAVIEHGELPDRERVAMQRARKRHLDALERAYAAGVAAGALADVPATIAVRVAIGTANWAARWYKPDGPDSRDDVRRYIEQILFAGMERGRRRRVS
jgi:AcrR family transcriptional regulator